VTLFEKADRIGGLLRYGIPDFKMEKGLVDRRVEQMAAEGVEFRTSVEVGTDIGISALLAEYDALALTGGAELPRDLEVPGRDLAGIHFAMDYLPQQNKRVAGDPEPVAAPQGTITAKNKHVIVIGGGDTGSDCIGTANRQGAKSITQIEILPKPPDKENKALVWPDWPLKLRTSSSQEEGCQREWAVLTKRAIGRNGHVEKLECVRVEWMQSPDGRWAMQEVPNSSFELKADLVLLAMGFLGPRKAGMIEQAGITLDPRGNIAANTFDYKTSAPKIFSAGDMRRGQSLVVWAIREGRQCARAIDEFLMGSSLLPR
jgi:glutamate synthase (NADPH/NADH) small chain